jgi:membrane protease YdiL (CAAX protease family)
MIAITKLSFLYIFFCFILLSTIFSIVATENPALNILLINVSSALLIFIYAQYKYNLKVSDISIWKKPDSQAIVWLIWLGIWMVSIISVIVDLVLLKFENLTDLLYVQELESLFQQNIWVLIFIVVIIPPLYEELLFRGIIQSLLIFGNWGKLSQILFPALFFSILHLNVAIPGIFLLGVILGWIRQISGSIIPGIIVHFSYNAFIILNYLYLDLDADNSLHINFLLLPFALIFIIISLLKLKRLLLPSNTEFNSFITDTTI